MSTSKHSAFVQQTHRDRLLGIWGSIHVDPFMLSNLMVLLIAGVLILYSAGNESTALVTRQLVRFSIAFGVMIICAQIPPHKYYRWIPFIYSLGVFLLVTVLIIGHIGKGAQRWLNLGLFRFQPSELMKIAVPMMAAWYLHDKRLPPSLKTIAISSLIFFIPFLLVAKQPDLGTAILIMSAGAAVLIFAGLSWRLMSGVGLLAIISFPIAWHFLHHYQRERVLTFLNPERDPLGSGYHIIQSKIAIGSGGFFGKGWLAGTQSHLQFLPEHATDFIFAVCGEEFGFIGSLTLLALFLALVARCLYISSTAQDTFSRLLAGSLSFTFFISIFVNMGMVTGILPVVGLPLPLISYGGTSMVTVMAAFGIIMAIHSHRPLIGR